MAHRAGAALLAAFLLLTAGCASAGSTAPSTGTASPRAGAVGTGTVSRTEPRCTKATQRAPSLPAGATAMTASMMVPTPGTQVPQPVTPFGVAVTATGRWAFASLGNYLLGVLRLSAGRAPRLVRTVALPEPTEGAVLTPDGRLLLLAGAGGAVVVSVTAAEQGRGRAVLGQLSGPPGADNASATEVAVSADGRYAFVSLEAAEQIAVYDLAAAEADGFGGNDGYVGTIPMQVAPVGLAVSPNGRWLYATSAEENQNTEVGTLAVISVQQAESNPAAAVVGLATAGCGPLRVITSADGSVVWVTASASDALLAFSADRLRSDPAHALLADVRVGEEPLGLALAKHRSLVVTADSDLYGPAGQAASLAVVDVADALKGRPALVGYLPAGQYPRDVAASPDGSTVLVANYDSGQLETVNGAALP
jgi:DNA-binding beta-propeller fold protein YncE